MNREEMLKQWQNKTKVSAEDLPKTKGQKNVRYEMNGKNNAYPIYPRKKKKPPTDKAPEHRRTRIK